MNHSALRAKTASGITQKNRLTMAVSTAVMASVVSSPSWAQTLEEVMVTATKRSESVQDVPLAITALSGDFVSKMNLWYRRRPLLRFL
jgi:iron complex outermembrane receptor protein